MDLSESNSLRADPESLPVDINLPIFDQPQAEHWPVKMSWAEAMQHFAASRDLHMRKFDSPEKRWHEKNPAPFVLP